MWKQFFWFSSNWGFPCFTCIPNVYFFLILDQQFFFETLKICPTILLPHGFSYHTGSQFNSYFPKCNASFFSNCFQAVVMNYLWFSDFVIVYTHIVFIRFILFGVHWASWIYMCLSPYYGKSMATISKCHWSPRKRRNTLVQTNTIGPLDISQKLYWTSWY